MSRYYTEVQLEDAWDGKLRLGDWQSGDFIPPLQYLKTHHLPTMRGATTLPPAGRFASPKDIFGDDSSVVPPTLSELPFTPVGAAAVLLIAFYLFLPQRV